MANTSIIPEKLRTGFKSSFWVANIMELFERLAYYGQATILSVFLRDQLKFNEEQAGTLSSIFGGLIYFLPIFAGALADKFGFRKAFSFAFLVLALGYFLIGSTGMEQFSSFYGENRFPYLIGILIFTAIGGSFIKPSVLGTIAMSSSPETKSLGYAVYYWLVNIGAAIGPSIAYLIRQSIGMQAVYVVSSLSCLAMFITTLLLFKEPSSEAGKTIKSMSQITKDLIFVLANGRFMSFLLIFSLFWLMFWQIFIIIPWYITDFISKDAPFEIIQSMGAIGIIVFQIPVNIITKKIPSTAAIVLGFFIASLGWLVISLGLFMFTGYTIIYFFIAGIIVFSLGEMTQAPRYYEYIADLAPKGQEALFQGYAFLPIAIGWLIGGTLGGWMYNEFAKNSNQPYIIFIILLGIGLFATVMMWLYTLFIRKKTVI